jgi:hypothetical protein
MLRSVADASVQIYGQRPKITKISGNPSVLERGQGRGKPQGQIVVDRRWFHKSSRMVRADWKSVPL